MATNKKQRYAAVTQQDTPMTIQDTTQQSTNVPPMEEQTQEPETQTQEPTQEQTQATPNLDSPEVQSTAATEVVLSDFETRVADLKINGGIPTRIIISYLETYIDNMHIGKELDSTQGARYQNQLWVALFNMIQNADDNFEQAFSTVVNFFREFGTDDVFDERFLFRFAEELPMHQEHRNAFFNLLNLIKLLSTTKNRSDVVKQLDVERSIGSVYNDQGRNALHGYLSV